MRSWRGVLVAALATVLAAGCGGPVGGGPASAPSSEAPRRPAELRVDGVDPCTVLTEAQRAEFGLDRMPGATTATVFDDAPACVLRDTERELVTAITLAPAVGIEVFTDGGRFTDELTPVTVGGYPALLAYLPRVPDSCNVEIDVAPGQLVEVRLSDYSRRTPLKQLCGGAQDIAEEVLVSLRAR